MAKNKIYIPTFISSVNYAPARVLPHIYFYNGLKVSETWYLQGYTNGNTGSVTSNALESFPYFDNYEGQDPTSGSKSLLFFNEPAVYGTTPTGSLYTEYWENYINLLYNPRTRLFNCEAIIPLADYFKMELNDIVEWRGNYYHLRAINDYNLSNGECKLQLLGPILGDILPGIIPAIACDFNYTIDSYCPQPTTTTTTLTPTTSTTLAPTTTTTLAPTTTTVAPTTTTIAPTTTTIAPTTTTTLTPTTTTTAGPTTTTTTAAGTGSCDCVLFVAGGAGGDATYTLCGGGPVTQSLAGNQTLVVCHVSGTAALTGPSSVISYGYQIPANPDCASTSPTECLPSASCICVTMTQGNYEAGTYFYHDCSSNSIIAGTLGKNQSLSVCAVSGSWTGLTGTEATIVYSSTACSNSASCQPTTTTTTTIAPIEQSGLVIWNSCDSYAGNIWNDKSGNNNSGSFLTNLPYSSGSNGVRFEPTVISPLTYKNPLTNTPSSSWTMQMYGQVIVNNSYGPNQDLWCKTYYGDGWDTVYRRDSLPLGYPSAFILRDDAGNDNILEVSQSLVNGVTRLITITANADTNVSQLYIDGTLTYTSSIAGINNFTASALPLVFGWNADTDADALNGNVKDLILYNRVLSQSEILSNFNLLSSRSCSL